MRKEISDMLDQSKGRGMWLPECMSKNAKMLPECSQIQAEVSASSKWKTVRQSELAMSIQVEARIKTSSVG